MYMTSERLVYSRWTEDDFNELKAIFGDPKVCEYLPGPNQRTDEQIQKTLASFVSKFEDEFGTRIFKIETKDYEIIGYGGLAYLKEFDKTEIMYGLKSDAWGKGYGTEISLRCKALATELGYAELVALADLNNVPSNKILIKTGFQFAKKITLWGLELNYYEMTL